MKDGITKAFTYKGYPCQIVGYMGHYNGYIELPNTNSFYGVNYDDIPVDCHGGLTYSNYNEDLNWVIGFDCAHSDDLLDTTDMDTEAALVASRMNWTMRQTGATFKNLDYVEKELYNIINQLEGLPR